MTILSQLFCARVRQQLSPSEDVLSGELLTMEQVRRAADVVVDSMTYPPRPASGFTQKNSNVKIMTLAATPRPPSHTQKPYANDSPNSASTQTKLSPYHQNTRNTEPHTTQPGAVQLGILNNGVGSKSDAIAARHDHR